MKYLLIAVLCIIIIWMLNIKIIEGDTTIPNASGKIETGTIQDMRDFLEKMYSICLLNPNDTTENNTKNTNCFKVSILGAYLWPTLAGYTKQSLEDLIPIYGKSTEEKSLAGQMAEEQNTTPEPVPILLNDTDYQLFLQLAILGRLLQPFTSENWDNYNSAVIWFKDDNDYAIDGCKQRWGGYEGAISLVDEYLRKITLILGYFHSQTNNNNSVSNGDSVYTSMYSSYK